MALPKPARAPPAPSTNGDGPVTPTTPGARLTQHFHPAPDVPHHPEPADTPPASRPRAVQTMFGVMLLGALGYGVGWLVSFYGLLPGVFRASDIGVPALMFATLRGVAKLAERGLPHAVHAKAAAGLGRAGGWAISVYWLGTLTNVLQLGVGLALGILGYQAYVTHGRLQRAGFAGFGPAFGPTIATVVVYVAYQLLRIPLGPVEGFDAMSAAASFVAAIAIMRAARGNVQRAAREQPRPQSAADHAKASSAERRVLIGLVVGYLFFRLFISDVIPYGPIVEWFLVCIGVLFFAIIAADRIGTVPTRRSLPAPEKRTHVQRVSSLPDRQLAETQERLSAFIERGQETDWLRDHFGRILRDAGHGDERVAQLLAPLVRRTDRRGRGHAPVEAMGVEARSRFVKELVAALRTRGVPTGTLKADPGVQSPTHGRRAAAGA